MNLSKLFEMQKALDEKIVRDKGLEGQDLLPQKILALQVELGECANEWRGFKFWSKDQSPKIVGTKQCPYCKGTGYSMKATENSVTSYQCVSCIGGGLLYNPLLEEYVDCLHFILSIGLNVPDMLNEISMEVIGRKGDDITDRFITVMQCTTDFFNDQDTNEYQILLEYFIGLGFMLGFTWEQIEAGYLAKNQVNHERQVNGY